MNGKIKSFYESQGMTVEKNRAYGVVRGYETTATVDTITWSNSEGFPYKLFVAFYATDEQKAKIDNEFRNSALRYFKCAATPYGILFSFGAMTNGGVAKRLPELFDKIYNTISENGGKTSEYCPYCGEKMAAENSKKCTIGYNTVTMDHACVDKINSVIDQENAEFKAAPNNYLRGFIGALIGGAVGAVVAIILSFLNVIAAISAIVSVLLGAFLYQKFGGKPTKMMLVIVGLTTIVFMALAVPASYLIAAAIAVKEVGVNMGAMDAFIFCMEDSDFASGFYFDLILSLVFAVVCTIGEMVVLTQKIKRQGNIN